MAQAGGRLVSEDGKTAEANSDANVTALAYVQKHLQDGTFAYASDRGGWGGEAFGKQLGAMTIEGNWITGALGDYPDVKAKVVELPAGSAGKGTLQFTNCWGMAADSPNQKAALDLVEYLTSADQQLAFSKAFGPMPSVQSAAQTWKSDNPSLVAFLNGADYAQGVPTNKGAADVIKDFNAQLESLKTGDPRRSSTRCSRTSRPSSADHVRSRRPAATPRARSRPGIRAPAESAAARPVRAGCSSRPSSSSSASSCSSPCSWRSG
jgi:multiple sugar transport system substrate-binding protein